MKHVLAIVMIIIGFGGYVASQGIPTARADSHHAYLIRVTGSIQPVTARFLSRAVEKSVKDDAHFIVITLDTPGGLLDSTRDIVKSLLDSSTPIIVYVYPSGAQAASAGTFIASAAHISAMTPISNIGAASPVGIEGGDLPKTLLDKTNEDTAALLRSIAEERGRNIEALESTVLKARSYSASEALENNVIDLIADDLQNLLSQLNDRTVKMTNGDLVLDTKDIELRNIEKSILEILLGFLGNPTVAFMLLTLGFIGILLELVLGLGFVIPGITGVIALALAFVGMGELPVNWVGVLLLGVSIVLVFGEIHAPGTTVFGVLAVISFALGAIMLFGTFTLPGFNPKPVEAPTLQLSLWLIGTVTLGMSGLIFFLTRSIMSTREPGTSGSTTLLGLEGQAGYTKTDLSPTGTVYVAGEDWTAISDSEEQISKGEKIVVLEAEGLTLKVFKMRNSGK